MHHSATSKAEFRVSSLALSFGDPPPYFSPTTPASTAVGASRPCCPPPSRNCPTTISTGSRTETWPLKPSRRRSTRTPRRSGRRRSIISKQNTASSILSRWCGCGNYLQVTNEMKHPALLSRAQLERSTVVANSGMNRERVLWGVNSYQKELGHTRSARAMDILGFLTARAREYDTVRWVDLCCGTGNALIQAAGGIA